MACVGRALHCRVSGLGFRVFWGLGFRVWGFGFWGIPFLGILDRKLLIVGPRKRTRLENTMWVVVKNCNAAPGRAP